CGNAPLASDRHGREPENGRSRKGIGMCHRVWHGAWFQCRCILSGSLSIGLGRLIHRRGRHFGSHAPGVCRVAASTILLVDADPPSRDVIVKALTDVGYSITTVADEVQAFAEAGDHDLVILDILSGPKSAADVCREIRATPAMVAIPVLCISQTDDVDERIRFLQAGADDVIAKPYDALELQAPVAAPRPR